MAREISLAEVKKHNSDQSCWMVIHSNVYDVTKFLAEHPGGESSLLDYAGKDGSVAFEDVGHSDDAKNMMKKYKIGKLPDAENTPSSSHASCCRSPNARMIKKPSSRCDSCYSTIRTPTHIPCHVRSQQAARDRKRALAYKKSRHRSKTRHKKRSYNNKEEYIESTDTPNDEERGGYNLKWALVALAAALIAGVILKRSLAS